MLIPFKYYVSSQVDNNLFKYDREADYTPEVYVCAISNSYALEHRIYSSLLLLKSF